MLKSLSGASAYVFPGVGGKLLDHKQAQTTMRYAHWKPEAVKAAEVKAGELLQPKHNADALEPKRQRSSRG